MENKTFCRPFVLLQLDEKSNDQNKFYMMTSSNKEIPIVGYYDETSGTIRELLTNVALKNYLLSNDPRIPYFKYKNIDSSELGSIIKILKNLEEQDIKEYVNYIEKHIPCLKIYDTEEVKSLLKLIGHAQSIY